MAQNGHPAARRLLWVWMLAPVLAGAGEPPTPPVGRTRLALDHLAAAATAWHEGFQCGGCHKLPLTIAALSVARANGHDAPPPGTVAELVERLLDSDDRQDAQGCFSLDGQGITMATTYTARGMEAYDRHFDAKLRASLQAAAECLLGRQEADGRLTADLDGPPPSQGSFVTTANGALAWARAFELDGNPAYGNAANGAVAWLRSRIPTIEASPATFTTQDKAMLLMGLATAGTGPTDPDALRMTAILASEQNPDGSWKLKNSTAGGNGYATGQVVFALREIGRDLSDPALAAGRQWLLSHQQADGSWPVAFWMGNPPSQLAPSMWATLALASFPSPLTTLRAAPAGFAWSPVEGAESYDVIRGSLSGLTSSPASVSLGNVTCVASATTSTSAEDSELPPAGDAFFYLFRIRWGGNADDYGRATDGRERVPLMGACEP